MGRCSTLSMALFSARPMMPPYPAVAPTPAHSWRRCASPQALATASGSGLSCVTTSACWCPRATARSLRSLSRSAKRGVWSVGRSERCGEGALPMELGCNLSRAGPGWQRGRSLAPPDVLCLGRPQPLQAEQAGAVPLRRYLKIARDIAESRVIYQPAEGQGPDFSLADVLVAVHPAAQGLHAVVEVEGLEKLNAQRFFELSKRFVKSPVGGNVIPGREHMAGVEAHRHAFGAPAALADLQQLLEGPAQRAALAGGRLQQHEAGALVRRERAVQRLGDESQARLRLGVRAGMDDQVQSADQVAALQLIDERRDRPLAQLPRAGAKVDEIARVHADGKAGVLRALADELRIVGSDLFRAPHLAGFGEDLHGLGAVGKRAREGFVQPTRDGFVRAQEHGRRSLLAMESVSYALLAMRLRDISFQPGTKYLKALSRSSSMHSRST